jgi:hypothetical protein
MNDWRQKIDNMEEQQRQNQLRQQAAQKALNEERARKEGEARVRNLGEKFRCQICGKPAQIPSQHGTGTFHSIPHDPGSGEDNVEDTIADWSKPGDLWKCTSCNKWTCYAHIYKGICQKCAEKL